MSKKIIFIKMNINEAVRSGAVNVAVPMTAHDLEQYNKLKSPFKAIVTNPRNLRHHNKFWAICQMMIDNGILDLIPIREDVLYHIKLRYKDLTYVLVYIMKYLFIPLERKILPNGNVLEDVSSISFEEMNQDEFKVFYDKCLDYFCDIMQITKEQIEGNI